MITLRPPRLVKVIGTRTVSVRPSGLRRASVISALRSVFPARRSATRVLQAIDAQLQVQPVRVNLDALDEKLENARLLGGEQLVPHRIEAQQRLAHLGLGSSRTIRACSAGTSCRRRQVARFDDLELGRPAPCAVPPPAGDDLRRT